MKKFSDEDLSTIINKIQVLETPKKFRGQCIRSNAIQLLKELKERRESDGKLLDIKEQLKLIREKCPDVWNMKTIGCPADWLVVEDKFCSIDGICKDIWDSCWNKALEGDVK